jgi:hypothetical protein
MHLQPFKPISIEHLQSIWTLFVLCIWMTFLIYSQSEEEHKRHVCEILEQLQHYKLFVNLKKCVFYWHCRVFLRFIVSITEVTMNSQQIDTIKTWLTLKTFQKVQVFLKFVNFYNALLKPICELWAHLQVYWKTVRMKRRWDPLSDQKMLQRCLTISRKSLWQCSFLFTLIQSSRIEWRLMLSDTQWQEFTLSCRCQNSDTLLLTDCESCSQQKKVMRHMILSFSHCWSI